MPELSDLYSDRILEIAARISRANRLSAPDASATAHSKLCGSTVTVDLAVADGRVSDYGQTVKACLLGQAASSVMAAQIIGAPTQEVRDVAARMRAMLKAGGPPPDGRWADLAALEPVREVKGRHASALLVFDAVERALDQIDAA
jgi:NifU-like protein involved in Fe-S cluster formation